MLRRKAKNLMLALERLTPNDEGPDRNKKKLVSLVNSLLRYAILIWGYAPICHISSVRVSSAFCTVSQDDACVIAAMIYLHIFALERKTLYEKKTTIKIEMTYIKRRI